MSRKVTYKLVNNAFTVEGYILTSTIYINAKTKLIYVCPNRHESSITWSAWVQGKRCIYCAHNAPVNIEKVKKSLDKENYILLTTKYKNNHTKLNYICPRGHKYYITWNNWKTGYRCPYCSGLKIFNKDIEDSFIAEGYTLLSTYVKSGNHLEYICTEGHKHSMTWDNWRNGKRCPTCANVKLKMRMLGSGNHNWRGGISFEPYCEIWQDKEYKQDIRNRDGNKCLNPYCYGQDSKLAIHHIDYDKKNCHPSNLITLCRSCNSRANKDRRWHKAWYKTIIYRRYNY